MDPIKHVGVIDIGKTNAKVAVVDLAANREIGVLKRPNTVLPGPPYPHYDLDGHWDFILAALRDLHEAHGIDAISVTTHGASLVLLAEDGSLAAPMLDYEFEGPDDLAADYDAIRPPFSETGSPRLRMGLNAGAQLFWQLNTSPGLHDRLATVLTYPQYWSYRLTGVRANEVTSLGCHTDLWNPGNKTYSSLVSALRLEDKMAPVKLAGECLGTILPEIAAATGLPATLPVACGIHDSNASLYPHLITRGVPFSVVSTGTWVIALSIGGNDLIGLDPTRDTLINVNALGAPVTSARFMGGREFDMVLEGRQRTYDDTDVANVLNRQIMLFPAVDPRSGPFQGRKAHWSLDAASLTDGECFAALSFYLALITSECLGMISAEGPVVVEGPFAQNRLFLDMLEASTDRPVDAAEGSITGTSIGAALLARGDTQSFPPDNEAPPMRTPADLAMTGYADAWRKALKT